MKKFLVAALAALAVIAMAAVATAQDGKDGIVTGQTQTTTVTPTDAGTSTKPKTAKVKVSLVTDPDHDPTIDRFTYQFPKQLKVSTKGFKYCTGQFLAQQQSDAKCPVGSKVGNGTASARLGSRQGGQIAFSVAIYANKSGMTLWLEDTSGLDIRRAIPIVIQSSNTAGYSQDLVADIPPDVEQAAGAPVVLESVVVNIGASRKVTIKKNGKKIVRTFRVVSSVGCPANKQLSIATILKYKFPVGQPDTKANATDNCTK